MAKIVVKNSIGENNYMFLSKENILYGWWSVLANSYDLTICSSKFWCEIWPISQKFSVPQQILPCLIDLGIQE